MSSVGGDPNPSRGRELLAGYSKDIQNNPEQKKVFGKLSAEVLGAAVQMHCIRDLKLIEVEIDVASKKIFENVQDQKDVNAFLTKKILGDVDRSNTTELNVNTLLKPQSADEQKAYKTAEGKLLKIFQKIVNGKFLTSAEKKQMHEASVSMPKFPTYGVKQVQQVDDMMQEDIQSVLMRLDPGPPRSDQSPKTSEDSQKVQVKNWKTRVSAFFSTIGKFFSWLISPLKR